MGDMYSLTWGGEEGNRKRGTRFLATQRSGIKTAICTSSLKEITSASSFILDLPPSRTKSNEHQLLGGPTYGANRASLTDQAMQTLSSTWWDQCTKCISRLLL